MCRVYESYNLIKNKSLPDYNVRFASNDMPLWTPYVASKDDSVNISGFGNWLPAFAYQ